MCLAEVFLTRKKDGKIVEKNGTFFGYKSLIETSSGRISSDWFHASKGDTKWKNASNEVLGSNLNRYTSGFHIFLDYNDCLTYHGDAKYVYLVEFQNIVAIGKQFSGDKGLTVTAKKMRIVRKAEKGKDY
jgi:hypothetical protein